MAAATDNNTANCELCAKKILEFTLSVKNDDYVYLSFDNKKINMKTKQVEPTTVPFIYSTADFGTNLVLCNDDEYIKKLVDLPECANVNIRELNSKLTKYITGIHFLLLPVKQTHYYSPNMFMPNSTITFDKTHYIYHTLFNKYISYHYIRKRLAFCDFWDFVSSPITNRPTFDK
jgi:hypothetical protein